MTLSICMLIIAQVSDIFGGHSHIDGVNKISNCLIMGGDLKMRIFLGRIALLCIGGIVIQII